MSTSNENVLKNTVNQWGGNLSLFFCCIHICNDMNTGLMIALLPFVRQDLGLNYFQAGLLVSVFSITSGFSQLFGGWAGDKIKRRWIMIAIGLFGIGAGSFAIGLTTSFYVLLTVIAIMGILSGAYHPSAVPFLSSIYKDNLGKVLGLHMLGGSIGFGIGPFIGTAIATTLNWHMAFIILSMPALISGLSVLIWLRKYEPHNESTQLKLRKGIDSDTNNKPKQANLIQVIKSIAVMLVLVMLVGFTSNAILPFISLYLVDYHYYSNAVASIWIGVIRAVGIAGSLFGGWLTDKWGNKRTNLLILIASGPVLLLFVVFHNPILLSIMMIAFGILMAMRETAVQTYLMSKTPFYFQSRIFGIYFGLGMQGQSVVQPVYGTFMDMVGIASVFLITGIIGTVISISTIFVSKKL